MYSIVADPAAGRAWHPDRRRLDRTAGLLAAIFAVPRDSSRRPGVYTMSTSGGSSEESSRAPTDRLPPPDIEEVYREHAAAMYRTAVAIVRDHALAEDVVQDAAIKAWRNLDSYRAESSLRTWLLTITHNTAVSLLRRARDTPFDPERLPHTPLPGPEGGAVGDMFVDAFEAALFSLDETSRAAMALRELEQLPYEEIAEILGVPLPTVKTRIFRARRRLATELAGWTSP